MSYGYLPKNFGIMTFKTFLHASLLHIFATLSEHRLFMTVERNFDKRVNSCIKFPRLLKPHSRQTSVTCRSVSSRRRFACLRSILHFYHCASLFYISCMCLERLQKQSRRKGTTGNRVLRETVKAATVCHANRFILKQWAAAPR